VIIQQRKKRRGRATHGHENQRAFGNSEIVIFESHSVVKLSVERERVMREKERKRRERKRGNESVPQSSHLLEYFSAAENLPCLRRGKVLFREQLETCRSAV